MDKTQVSIRKPVFSESVIKKNDKPPEGFERLFNLEEKIERSETQEDICYMERDIEDRQLILYKQTKNISFYVYHDELLCGTCHILRAEIELPEETKKDIFAFLERKFKEQKEY